MGRKFEIKYLTEKEFDLWRRFVADSPDGCVYYTPEYLEVLCDAADARFQILAVLQKDEIAGGITLFERRHVAGPYVAPRLLLYYNGIALRDYESKYPSKRTGRQIEIQSLIRDELSKKNYARLMFRNRHTIYDARVFTGSGWRAEPAYTYVITLGDMDRLQSRIEQNLRRLIKRCEREGVRLTMDDDFESYFRLHQETHVRKGAPLYLPRAAYQKYFDRLREKDLCRLYHARLENGHAIASQLVLTGHAVTQTVSAAADMNYLNMGGNAFLRWKVFQDLSEAGYAANDLTDAALNPVSHFKSQLGADLRLCWIFRRRDRALFRYRQHLDDSIRVGKRVAAKLGKKILRKG
jgi:hypothetical protein